LNKKVKKKSKLKKKKLKKGDYLMATSALMFDINVCLVFDMNVWFFISIPQTIKKKH